MGAFSIAKIAYSVQEKYALIVAYQNRQTSVPDFCREYNISKRTSNEWVYRFQTYGMDGLHGSSVLKISETTVR
ncbi:helix-turn-helix domain-containing protein [Aneurinibacillus sp. Ricciae_BoGa-3]|uniref:helix-turn-helix domain-containing protein n=1 Tax=Aneurinibacillus sp. Ricciae_BoGa-3 TaxID=3022697 RepID=UPI003FA495DE